MDVALREIQLAQLDGREPQARRTPVLRHGDLRASWNPEDLPSVREGGAAATHDATAGDRGVVGRGHRLPHPLVVVHGCESAVGRPGHATGSPQPADPLGLLVLAVPLSRLTLLARPV